MSEEEGQQPEAGSTPEKPVEGTAPAIYDGPIEKFKGKTAGEIAQVYGDLESAFGKKDAEIKSHVEKLQAYEQWARTQQQQQQGQQQQAQQAQPQPPADIYDNPQGFVSQTVQPMINYAVEHANYRNALNNAKRVMFSAKQMYPGAFDGTDETKLMNTMVGGVTTGATHFTALESEDAWKMAAVLIREEESGYKAHNAPNPMNPAQTEQPGGGSKDGEPKPITQEARDMAAAFGKDDKTAQKLWDARQKKEAK